MFNSSKVIDLKVRFYYLKQLLLLVCLLLLCFSITFAFNYHQQLSSLWLFLIIIIVIKVISLQRQQQQRVLVVTDDQLHYMSRRQGHRRWSIAIKTITNISTVHGSVLITTTDKRYKIASVAQAKRIVKFLQTA